MCALREFLFGLMSELFVPGKERGGCSLTFSSGRTSLFIFFIVDRLNSAKGKRVNTEEPRQGSLIPVKTSSHWSTFEIVKLIAY